MWGCQETYTWILIVLHIIIGLDIYVILLESDVAIFGVWSLKLSAIASVLG